MTAKDDRGLVAQVAAEKAAIDNAPTVALGPLVGRCAWCGQPSRELEFMDEIHGIERYRGVECCGRRPHVQVRPRST